MSRCFKFIAESYFFSFRVLDKESLTGIFSFHGQKDIHQSIFQHTLYAGPRGVLPYWVAGGKGLASKFVSESYILPPKILVTSNPNFALSIADMTTKSVW